MSRHNRSRKPAPPSSRIAENLAGRPFFEITAVHVGSWCELPDGKGPASQVHVTVEVRGFPAPLVLRFKSSDGLDRFIDALERHRADVWPSA